MSDDLKLRAGEPGEVRSKSEMLNNGLVAVALKRPLELPALSASGIGAKPIPTQQLKGKSVRGGVVSLGTQALTFVVQTGSTMVLARLLSREDFGLQNMVVVVTGILALF